MIADRELRDLFRVESEERLQHLDDGLLRLEKAPGDLAALEALFREAHSLKGAARMLGLSDIQSLAHQLEDALGLARKEEKSLSPEAVNGMGQTLLDIRRQVKAALGEATAAEAAGRTEALPAAPQPTAEAVPATGPPGSTHAEAFRIETIRVDPKKLDALLTQVGELTVTRHRLTRRLADIDELFDACDNWHRALRLAKDSPQTGRQVMQQLDSLRQLLTPLRSRADEDSARLDFIADRLNSGVRTLRLLPMSTLLMLFPRLVHDLARDQGKEVELLIEGGDVVADKRVLEEMKDPLTHILRNAIDHGIEPPEQREAAGKSRVATIRILVSQSAASITIEVSDDGRGLDTEAIRLTALSRGLYTESELANVSEVQLQELILAPGFSTNTLVTEVSGRGVGLDVVRNNVEHLKGMLQLESTSGKGLTLRAQLPISLATGRVLIAATNGQRYALPVEQVAFARAVSPQQIYLMEGRQTVTMDGRPVSVARLDELLEMAVSPERDMSSALACVVLRVGDQQFGLIVDAVVDELEVVLKPQSKLLKRVRNIAGATILDTGEVCLVLNPQDLLKTLCKRAATGAPMAAVETLAEKKVLLLAEDSITTRTQEKRILEGAGYEVVTAVDGVDAFNKLGSRAFDAVVSDVMMPNMTGLALTAKIRADSKHTELPIILVTSMASDEDRRRGLEAGANAYIAKPEFDQRVLLECLARLV
ncbi:hybrid sensor histidine kinase/response regulator [Porticoccus sp.]